MGEQRTTYSKEFKIHAVKIYLEDSLSYREVIKELQIPDTKTIRLWVKRYKSYGIEGLEERRGRTVSPLTGRPRIKLLSVEEENKRLKAENEFLKKLLVLKRR